MNRRLLTILLISFAIAGACAFLVYKIVGTRMMAAKPVVTTRVVAAANDIKLGAVLAVVVAAAFIAIVAASARRSLAASAWTMPFWT